MDTNFNSTMSQGPWSLEFTRDEHFVIGLIYVCLIPPAIFFQISVIKTFLCGLDFKDNHTYQIMAHMGIFEVVCLFHFLVRGFKMVTYCKLFPIINQFMGATAHVAYMCTILTALVLALSRFDMLCHLTSAHTNKKIYSLLILSIYCFGAFDLAVHSLPGNHVVTDMTKIDFQKSPTHTVILQVEIIGKLTAVGCYALLYGGMCFMLYKTNKNISKKSSSSHEKRLLIQSMVVCFYKAAITVAYWYYAPTNRLAVAILLSLSVLESAYNPFLYIFMSKTVIDRNRNVLRVHTNKIEGFWNHVKHKIKRLRGTSEPLKETYVAEAIFRQNGKVEGKNVLEMFFEQVSMIHRIENYGV